MTYIGYDTSRSDPSIITYGDFVYSLAERKFIRGNDGTSSNDHVLAYSDSVASTKATVAWYSWDGGSNNLDVLADNRVAADDDIAWVANHASAINCNVLTNA